MHSVNEIAQNRSINQVFIDRGMTVEEVKALLHAPMPDRERAFYRAVYETFYRANELLMCDIETYDRKTGELIARHTKNKYNPKTKQKIRSPPKHMKISPATMLLFKKIIGNRKKGAIFVNNQGKRLTKTYLQRFINDLAIRIGIQKITHITPSGKEYHLVTLKALRESGERHADFFGADPEVTARGSQHSMRIKERHYKRSGWDEINETVKKHHPAFRGKI
jgi:site-specific recombinase XerC